MNNKVYFITNRFIDPTKDMSYWVFCDPNNFSVGEAEIVKKFKRYNIKDESLNFYIKNNGKEKLDYLFNKLKEENLIILFHGFATSFENSLCNVLKLKENFQKQNYNCNIVVFSWASNGKVNGSDYLEDQEDARKSAITASYLFEYIKNNMNNKNLNVICHSMGNYLLRHVYQLYKEDNEISKIFNSICLVEADEDYDTLEDNTGLKGIHKLAEKISIFYNHNDWVLKYSDFAFKNNDQRLGYKGPKNTNNLPSNIKLVDATQLVDKNQHNYIYNNSFNIFKKIIEMLGV